MQIGVGLDQRILFDMRTFFILIGTVILCTAMVGCEPEEQYHARMLGGQLRSLNNRWNENGRPTDFVVTNYIYVGWTTNQFCIFTNKVRVKNELFQCRFGIRDPAGIVKSGVLAITEKNTLLWLGDDGKIVVNPDQRRWSSE
jgi:hypothetical protein